MVKGIDNKVRPLMPINATCAQVATIMAIAVIIALFITSID